MEFRIGCVKTTTFLLSRSLNTCDTVLVLELAFKLKEKHHEKTTPAAYCCLYGRVPISLRFNGWRWGWHESQVSRLWT